jgi:hypothetical protein
VPAQLGSDVVSKEGMKNALKETWAIVRRLSGDNDWYLVVSLQCMICALIYDCLFKFIPARCDTYMLLFGPRVPVVSHVGSTTAGVSRLATHYAAVGSPVKSRPKSPLGAAVAVTT